MKNLLALLLLLSLFAPATQAQLSLYKISPDTFRIQKFPVRYFYAGEKLRKPKQVESILLAKNDLQINRDWQTAKTVREVGTGVMFVGLVLEAVGLIQSAKGNERGTSLLLGGVGLMLGGGIVGAFANGPSKRAMGRYNGLHTGRIAPLAPPLPPVTNAPGTPAAGAQPAGSPPVAPQPPSPKTAAAEKPCPCVGFRTGLNASKLWEIGGSDELKTDEKSGGPRACPSP